MSFKAFGAILMPYTRIGGCVLYPPPALACLQTDGSFRHCGPQCRVAAVLLKADRVTIRTDLMPIDAASSTETEWASVAFGLHLAIRNGETGIGIENDNLSVVQGLIYDKQPLKHAYARHYRREIQHLATLTAWTGVRWIPREANHADRLF